MAMQPLRQPKVVTDVKPHKSLSLGKNYVIITMKEERKLVVSTDSYNGILYLAGFYKCLFCGIVLKPELNAKEKHIRSLNHARTLVKYPHVDKFSHNLIRELTDVSTYCTLCNVIVANVKLVKHIYSEVHLQELERADIRALTYKASE